MKNYDEWLNSLRKRVYTNKQTQTNRCVFACVIIFLFVLFILANCVVFESSLNIKHHVEIKVETAEPDEVLNQHSHMQAVNPGMP